MSIRDHILGIVWMIRMIATGMLNDQYQGDAYIYYCHDVTGGYHPHPVPPDHPGKAFPFSGQPDPPDPLKDGGSPRIS